MGCPVRTEERMMEERIRKINKLLLITYNLGGVCLIAIGHLRGIGASPGYIPTGIKIVTAIVFSTMLIAHLIRYIMERTIKK